MIGSALVARLSRDSHDVVRLVRSDASGHDVHWDPAKGELDPGTIDGADAVINLAGAGIGDHRWTDEYRHTLRESRLATTALLATTMAAAERPPRVFLSGSAVGYYGDRADEVLDEQSSPGTDFLAELCVDWEAETAPAEEAGIRVVHLRTGIVLSAKGGALKKQLPLFKFGLGGKFGKGDQWWSWIAIDDEVGAIVHLLDSAVSGPVNLTAPNPVRNAELAKALGRALKRPSFLRVPEFGPKLVLGGELADALLFSGQRALPTVLGADGYRFRHPTIDEALTAILRS